MKKYNAVVIGLGHIGFKVGYDIKRKQPASHVSAILKNERLNLIAVCDCDKISREFFKKKIKKEIEVIENYKILLEKIENGIIKCDILVISTPEKTHKKIIDEIIKKLYNTKKSVIIFCEKPLTTDIKSTLEIKKKIQNSKLKLVINHSRRWSKVWRKGLKLSKIIGDITDAEFNYSTSPENKFKDQMRDGIHIADIISWFKIKDKIYLKRKNVNYFIYNFYLWGKKGKIEILDNGTILNYFISKKSKNYQGFNELVLKKSFKIEESMMENTYDEFIKFLDGKILNLSTNIEDAISAVKIFEKYVYSKNGYNIK
jgi:hypothetical protein